MIADRLEGVEYGTDLKNTLSDLRKRDLVNNRKKKDARGKAGYGPTDRGRRVLESAQALLRDQSQQSQQSPN